MKNRKVALYVHGKGGSAAEAEQFEKICAGYDVIGVDYNSYLPWVTAPLIRDAYIKVAAEYSEEIVIANSIGAYFSMLGLADCPLAQALFVSPVVDMERLICDMMQWAKVTEAELMKQKEIPTDFGETLSMEYLTYARAHPIRWNVPTEILYADGDYLTSHETIGQFARLHHAGLTVMEHGEHWFHTPEQLSFLIKWMSGVLSKT